ncbi:ribonuclease BN [Solidesulfovibrio fructosivorans JJ]]|uniref:Ribonuclease BN n=1 Tax=Solidesulfovibrio fructosivorans JJ] TaxID=596151 RepID=E1JUH5_SOLFR|nr:YihY/virulence factor BrkB family protein [Solidesulfovibrio fructosivorans]EFL52105.1 ribonuclease BN [Solidesulfovibrio fructosivorans JJ]]
MAGSDASHRAASLAAAIGKAFTSGRLPEQSPLPPWLGPFFHVLHLFLKNHGLSLAAALSYTTVLSIVPFLAVAFSVAKGLGFYDSPQVHDLLMRITAGRAEVVEQIQLYIQNTNVKTLGAIGTVLLLVTAVSLVSTIEGAINAAWDIGVKRGFVTRFTSYLLLIIICPPLLFAAVSAMAAVQDASLTRRLLEFSLVQDVERIVLSVAPVLIVWTVFFVLYQFLPNTRVKPRCALIGAFCAGTLWQLVQWAYIKFQFGAAGYNAIYGSFAQIPLLLLWLYISWAIVLLGAQISHTAQRYGVFLRQSRADGLVQSHRHALALFLLLLAARAAARRRLLPDITRQATLLGLPEPSVAGLWQAMAASGLAVAADGTNGRTFVPLARPQDVTLADVARALDGNDAPPPAGLVRDYPLLARLCTLAGQSDRTESLASLEARFAADLDAALPAKI